MEKLECIIPDQFRDTASVSDLRAQYAKEYEKDPSLQGPRLLWYLINFSRRAQVIEKGTIQLLTGLMTISGDERLVERIAQTEFFPAEYEAEYICKVVSELRKRVAALVRWKESREPKEDDAKQAERLSVRKSMRMKSHRDVRSIFEMIINRVVEQAEGLDRTSVVLKPRTPALLEDECLEFSDDDDEKHKDEDPVCTMYDDLTGRDVKSSILDEVQLMKKHFKKISADHQNIRATFATLKGQVSWNLLCKCFEEIDKMKSVIDKITAGDIEFIEPKQILVMAKKLTFVEDKLYDMEENLFEIPKEKMRKMLDKACPILEMIGLAEVVEDRNEENMRTAADVAERTRDVKLMIEYCSELIAEQITQMAGRMVRLIETEAKLEEIIRIKADKEYFFHVIDEKADKVLVNNLVSECYLNKEYQEICRKLCDYLVMLMKKMMMWIETLKVFQIEVQCTVEDDEFQNIKKKLLKRLSYLKKQVKNLEDGYRSYKIKKAKFDMRPFKDLTCFVDELPAVMYNKPDSTVPILDACPMKLSIAPDTALNLNNLRGRYEEYKKKIKPCTRIVCPRDFDEQIVCPICLGQSKEPCKHKKSAGDMSYKNVRYWSEWPDDEDDSSEDSEDDEEKHVDARKKKKRKPRKVSKKVSTVSEQVSSSIVKEILKGIF